MWGKDKKAVVSDKIDTLIASNVTIEGNVHFSGGIQIDGNVIGNVVADDESGSLVRITDKGCVRGEIRGPNLIINGHVQGDVFSTEHVELAAKAIVTGNVHYNLIEMVMGAEVNGSLMHVGDEKAQNKAKSTKSEKAEKPLADLATVANAGSKGSSKPDSGVVAQ